MSDDEQGQEREDSVRLASTFALALEQCCSALIKTVDAALNRLGTRLEASERSVRHANALHSQRLQALHDSARRRLEELDEHLRQQRQQLQQRQREAAERREEKQWLAELWPDRVPLPTLLQPFASGTRDSDDINVSIKDVKDTDERRRLEALVARRAAKERVLQRLEAAKHWTMVLPPATEPDEESPKPYYVHSDTGESTWDAPTALFFEPPEGWDAVRMDWKASYPLENFYPKPSDDDEEEEARDDGEDGGDDAEVDERSEEDTDDDGGANEELDPVECRREMEKALAEHEQLTAKLEQSKTQQRALALQLLNATREAFEREKQALQEEDKAVKDAERKRRRAAEQEQAAARAKAAAAERKRLAAQNPGQPLAMFARDSLAKKGLSLAKDDDALEKELEAFALTQRADRPLLTAPLCVDQRAREHHKLDAEFAHVKQLEEEVQRTEQLEFDLLEKTSLRHEEAATRSDELRALAASIRAQQGEAADEIPRVEASLTRLEVPLASPSDIRPTEDELERAKERFITPEPFETGEDDAGGDEDEQQEAGGDGRTRSETPFAAIELDSQLLAQDERELRELKRIVDTERQWRLWEKEEGMRQQELAEAQERRNALASTQRSLAVDLALCEADEAFFSRLRDLEKAGNARMWAVQADSQVERVRFMIERAAREESVYQVTDRLQELRVQLEEAQRLPQQAINAVERLQLEEKSAELVRELERKAEGLRERLTSEEEAKALLLELELRSSRYFQQKLDEESALFSEKQALWDLNVQLVDELQSERHVIARLYQLMESGGGGGGEDALSLVDEASRAFEVKLQLQQQVRQFLLSCYEREARWRGLAAVAFVKDCSSERWMTSAQRERHEQMLALLQEQHEERVAALQRELKLRGKVETQLREHIEQLRDRQERMRREYQASDDAVRCQTRVAMLELQREIEALTERLRDEQQTHRSERERLIAAHNRTRQELEQRLGRLEQANESQRHWLTAAKRELTAQRVGNDELLKAVQALEQRRATEVNDLRFRVAAQVAKINTVEMWNLALKLKAKEANAERVKMAREFAAKTEQHRQLQRLLRLQVWRHRVAAQAVLSDVDLLFAFFADGLDILAGATKTSNDALRENAGVRVLATLAAHSIQPGVRAISAQALGRVAWDSNATERALGWRAKRTWLSWVRTQSDRVLAALSAQQLEFDAVPSEASTSANWLDDPASPEAVEVEDAATVTEGTGKKLRFVRSWLLVEDREVPDGNAANQEHIGLTPGVLQTIVDLCRGQPEAERTSSSLYDSRVVQRNALESLALVAMNTRNTAVVGRMDGVIPLLARLIRSPVQEEEDNQASASRLSDWEIVRCAVRALGNLAFENRFNQQHACAVDDGRVIPVLLSYCDPTRAVDVDLALASVQALANLVRDFTPACERVLAAGGVTMLTRLCHSPLIHDAVDPDASERIQAHAALVLSTVVTLLDSDDCEADGRGASVADAVMKEEAEGSGGVAAFVLMCASCNRSVAFYGALVLGSVARHDAIRAAIGAAGGVDALFLLAASAAPDNQAEALAVDALEVLATAVWALANLTWSRDNQYRVARYLPELSRLCAVSTSNEPSHEPSHKSSHEPSHEPSHESSNESSNELEAAETVAAAVHEHALCVLANALFYNDANRLLVARDGSWLALLERECLAGSGAALEHAARALCALSYNDELALAMGASRLASSPNSSSSNSSNNNNNTGDESRLELPFNGLALLLNLCAREDEEPAAEVLRLALSGVVNLVLHDANKPRLLRVPLGVETLVNRSAHASAAVRAPALEALELLADVRRADVRPLLVLDAPVGGRTTEGLARMAALLRDPRSSTAVVAMAADALADEAWRRPSAKARLRNSGALEALLLRCGARGHSDGDKAAPGVPAAPSASALASCLWATRNAVADNVSSQDAAGALGGVAALAALLRPGAALDVNGDAAEDVVEAALAALTALVLRHARNSQELVREGLDALLALADREDARAEAAALARELLQLVAPHNAPQWPPLATKSPMVKALTTKSPMTKSPGKTAIYDRLPALDGR